MSDFESKLNAILSDPTAMASIAGIARSLQEAEGHEAPSEDKQPPAEERREDAAHAPELSSLSGLFGQLDPSLLEKLLPLLNGANDGDSYRREQLLTALQPFLKPERRDRLHRAVQTAKLLRIGRTVLGTMGDSHV